MLAPTHVQPRSSSVEGTGRLGAARTLRAFAAVVALALALALAGAPVATPAHAATGIAVTQVADIGPSAGSFPDWLTVFDGRLYFSASDGVQQELWRTDGTAGGTAEVKRIRGAFPGSAPNQLTVFNEHLYFTATDGIHGRELWRTDGTESGTELVADINPGPSSALPNWLTVFDGHLYFTANDGTHSFELWRTDGTEAGTELVIDINPGPASSGPRQLTVFGDHLYFGADDGVHGRELWRTDGTTTELVNDIRAGTGSSAPDRMIVFDGHLYFVANNGITGRELWRTDGVEVLDDEPPVVTDVLVAPNPVAVGNSATVTATIELPPAGTLSGLVKRDLKGTITAALKNPADIDEVAGLIAERRAAQRAGGPCRAPLPRLAARGGRAALAGDGDRPRSRIAKGESRRIRARLRRRGLGRSRLRPAGARRLARRDDPGSGERRGEDGALPRPPRRRRRLPSVRARLEPRRLRRDPRRSDVGGAAGCDRDLPRRRGASAAGDPVRHAEDANRGSGARGAGSVALRARPPTDRRAHGSKAAAARPCARRRADPERVVGGAVPPRRRASQADRGPGGPPSLGAARHRAARGRSALDRAAALAPAQGTALSVKLPTSEAVLLPSLGSPIAPPTSFRVSSTA
jgi:ELWxxDGT repeat protein